MVRQLHPVSSQLASVELLSTIQIWLNNSHTIHIKKRLKITPFFENLLIVCSETISTFVRYPVGAIDFLL
ncbi:MAG: hypothetical protein Pg6B_03070 [Candidatus Azobacteroides pseudotrichonymphae]|jgi:hypothetical protein|uniref:hypothetical protein n=1 Tax=Candidatus Azobacteroides pseudotrichonymphae TaxID=511435 RepID=UPI00223C611D|nr:hypothetical protein [Candidatus Azobacteroides pseudotrichonymphae]GMO33203.1 MAG: hypothetical protein Pg6B_03070 [Candidatus Azobacteroides pseudotrichonymphae]